MEAEAGGEELLRALAVCRILGRKKAGLPRGFGGDDAGFERTGRVQLEGVEGGFFGDADIALEEVILGCEECGAGLGACFVRGLFGGKTKQIDDDGR